jgi:hypothetical protein
VCRFAHCDELTTLFCLATNTPCVCADGVCAARVTVGGGVCWCVGGGLPCVGG